jgi:hypothetical protein
MMGLLTIVTRRLQMKLKTKVTRTFFVPGDPDKACVDIEYLTPAKIREIDAKANELSYTANPDGDGQTQLIFNPFLRSKLIAHACVKSWVGFEDTMGNPLKLSKKNLDLAADYEIETEDGEVIDFFAWVNQCQEELREEVQAREEEAEKN